MKRKLRKDHLSTEVVSLATPLLVPMIEEGFIFDDISNAIIRTYLSNESLPGIQALILGCTHYPIIKNQISKIFNFNVEVVDSARIVSMILRDTLEKNDLLNDSGKVKGSVFTFLITLPTLKRLPECFLKER